MIHHGVDASLPGLDLSEVVLVTTLQVDDLEEFDREMVREGIPVDDLTEARDRVAELSSKRMTDSQTETQPDSTDGSFS